MIILILIIDDSLESRLLLKTILEKAGYQEILLAGSAQAAFSLLDTMEKDGKQAKIDLILMDILMPEMNGIEATKRIKETEGLQDIPIVVVTGSTEEMDLDQAFLAGANDYITKPFKRTELLVRIRSALALKQEMDKRKSRERKLQREIELAKKVQLSVLSKPLHHDGISIDAIYQPSEELSGDMYGWYQISDHRYGVFLCDVMGHGVSASLVSISIRTLLRDLVTHVVDPVNVMQSLNDHMFRFFSNNGSHNRFCTAIYMVIDLKNNVIEYVNAGHPPGLALMSDSTVLSFQKTTPPLGFVPQLKLEKTTVPLQDISCILLYTDGVVEEPGKSVGENIEKVKQMLREGVGDDCHQFMKNILVQARKDTSATDDMCLITIQLNPD
jgi:sigma-B regulation protein RsbU (phosphoserine phosphatase)